MRCSGASARSPASIASRFGSTVPWRDAGNFGDGFQFSVEGRTRENGQDDPRARFRSVSPGFFAALGMPIVAGRDFNEGDRIGAENGRDHQREPRASSCSPARIRSTAT